LTIHNTKKHIYIHTQLRLCPWCE